MKILENTKDTVMARGSILDQVHNIAIELLIDINSLEIISAEAQMVKVPFPECKPALENVKKLVGMRLNAGISQRIIPAIGAKEGCIHLSEVVVETVRLAANSIFGIKCGGKAWREGKMSDQEFWNGVKPLLKGTCIVFPDKEKNVCK
jgi:hypothetical protein